MKELDTKPMMEIFSEIRSKEEKTVLRMPSSRIPFTILCYIPSDQGVPVENFGNSAMLTGEVNYTVLYMQPIPCLLCSPLEPRYDVNIRERSPTKSALLGQTGYTNQMDEDLWGETTNAVLRPEQTTEPPDVGG
jgi:hypothetical protein